MTESSELIGRLLTGPDDTELTARDLALLAAHLHNNRVHPSWWQQRNRGIECPELERYQKLKTILDFNRNLQRALASSAPDRANSNAGTTQPAAKSDQDVADAHKRLLQTFTTPGLFSAMLGPMNEAISKAISKSQQGESAPFPDATTEHNEGDGLGSCSPLAGRGEDVFPATRLVGVGRSKNAEFEQVSESKIFSGDQMVFYADRVELCGVTICDGPRCEQARKTLDLLRQKNSKGNFIAFGSKKLAEKLDRKGGPSSVPGHIRDMRTRIVEELGKSHIACQRDDVIEQTRRGYQFRYWISVQDGETIESPAIEGHDEAASLDDGLVNGPVDVPVDSDDADPVSESVDAAVARQKWILEQVTKGRKMRAPGFATELGCSPRTVKRDLDKLECQIVFVGAPRTGYYQLRPPPRPGK